MGVGRENKDVFFSPYVHENEMQILENQSGQSTDEEDIPPSNGRSHHRQRNHRVRPRSASVEACLTGMYRRCGAKQARRTENIKYLLNLKVDGEEDESSRTPTYNSNTSAFTVLLQEREKMQAWNDFVNSSEEDQQRILHMRQSDAELTSIREESSDNEDNDNGNTNDSLDDSWEKVMTSTCDKRTVHPSFSAEECFERVDKNLRSMLTRRHLPLGLVSQLEKEVVDFFEDCPGSVYVSHLASSFERLLLHAVCQFLGLHCHSHDENGQRRTQVENHQSSFFLPSETLADYLARIS